MAYAGPGAARGGGGVLEGARGVPEVEDTCAHQVHRMDIHKIRHSVAQWYVEGGGPVEGLQIIMGHKNIATTQGYYQRHLKIKKRARKSINFNL